MMDRYFHGANPHRTFVQIINSGLLSTETVGGFTGVYIGLYATGNGIPSKSNAVYEWFDYEGR